MEGRRFVKVRWSPAVVAFLLACAAEPPMFPVGDTPTTAADDAVGDDDGATGSVTSSSDSGEATAPADDATPTGADGPTTSATSDGDDAGASKVCAHTCRADADCLFFGEDVGYECRNASCVYGPWACIDDEVCVAAVSGWTLTPCTENGHECEELDRVCVDVGDGTGGCASPSAQHSCAALDLIEVAATLLATGSVVSVCGSTGGHCSPMGMCVPLCTNDEDCNGLGCDVATGVCECMSDAECVAQSNGADTCLAGTCVDGCVSPDDCFFFHEGGTITCE